MQDEIQSADEQNEGDNPAISITVSPIITAGEGFSDKEPRYSETPDANQQVAKWTRVVARWTKALVGVGVLTAAVLFFQFWAMVENQRAFVFPSHVAFAGLATDDISQPILLDVELSNYGGSVATIEKVVAAVTKVALQPNPNYEAPNRVEPAYPPIPEKGKMDQELNFLNWGRETAINVRDGIEPFHIYGRVTYRDDYSTLWGFDFFGDRVSDFCYVYVANKADPSKAFFRNCPEPNYTHTQ